MSKIQLIEQSLTGINDAKFQSFCNDYFFWKGYDFVTSSGSVIGKEKARKGTPDTYIPINDNEYIFVEYTTKDRLGEAKSFFDKLSNDIDHCFDESKSKIKNSQIQKVILCFTQKLKVGEHNELRQKCAAYGAEFEAHGIDQLTKAVLLYPTLGKDFLDIPIDTQQLLTPTNFIKEYEKGKLATGLSNKLFFREDEINNAISILGKYDLLIIEGNAGVGKSRLALEVINRFCNSNSTYTPICIDNKGCPIYEDVRVHLQSEKDYILLVDDANRATKHYEFLTNLLKEDRKGSIKILATVRDYALNIVEDASKNFVYDKVKVNPLSDKQIREILESDDFKITNRAFSDVIVRVAQGNPRLAIMAAKVALEKQDLSAFNEIPKIYDSYYDEVVKEINELGDITFLKVLGIISFFKAIGKGYRNNEEIFSAFGITENEFWEKVITLHQMELVDLFDNEVVKISDQILATYFFYKTFIRDGILDFSMLITNFYENQNRRFSDMIYPVTNTFGFGHIKEKITGALDQAWLYFEGDESLLLKFLSIFWIFRQEKVLAHIGHQVANLPQDLTENYVFEKDKKDIVWDTNDKDYFGVLKQFLKYPSDNYTYALDLVFSYLEKQPFYIAEFVHHVQGELSFDRDDYQTGFFRQKTLFEKLIGAIRNGRTPKLFRGIFYHIVNTFLQTAFQKSGGVDRDNSFTMYTYTIPDIPPILDFRKKIWRFLFEEFENSRKNIVQTIATYTLKQNLWGVKDTSHKKKFWDLDSKLLLPFIERNFDAESYEECKAAQKYLKELEGLEIPFNKELYNIFINDKFNLLQILKQDLIYGKWKHELARLPEYQREGGGGDWDRIHNLKIEELRKFTSLFEIKDYKKLWNDVNELWESEKDRNSWGITTSFFQILHNLVNKDVKTFLVLIEHIFNSEGFPDNFSANYCNSLTINALKSLNENHIDLFKLINKYDGQDILHWKFAFFRHVEGKYVNAYYTKEMLKCVKQVEGYWSFFNLDFLSKYQYQPNIFEVIKGWFFQKVKNANRNTFTKVISILLEQVKNEKSKISFGWDFISKHSDKFKSNYESLKQVYLSNYMNDHHFDLDGKEMKTLCDLQPSFLIEFMKEFYGSEYSRIGRDLPIHNFRFVWDFDNYSGVIDNLMEFSKEKKLILMDWEHFANKFFVAGGEEQNEKRLNYIKSYIEKNAENKEAVQLIFNVITYSFSDKRLEFLKLFFEYNQDPVIFEALSFHTNGVYSGSRIPIIEGKIEFMNQLEKMLDSLPDSSAFIKHRAIVKSKVEYLKREIGWEKKREFEDYFG